MVIELMEGSLHGHLKEKYNTYKKICESKATSAEETGFMFVPINVMTNWLRKEFDSNILYCDTSYSILHPYPWFTRNRPILRSFIIESNGPGRNIIYFKKTLEKLHCQCNGLRSKSRSCSSRFKES